MLTRLQTGVSLVEVIVGLVVLSIMLALGVPQYATYLANARLKATTDTLISGLSMARAEAVNRNGVVELLLTDDEPVAGLVNTAPASTSGVNWIARAWNPRVGTYEFIEGKFGAEGSGSSSGTTIQVASTNAIISFNGLGAANPPTTIQVTSPQAGACVAGGGPLRCLTITVTLGGQIRTCDPAVAANSNDTRSCPNPLP